VELDEGKTRQVIMNFIDNALYYTPKGDVTVTLDRAKDKVRLEVKDTGIGVPKEAREKLFTKFFRAGNAQMVRPDGTGLGLYLAKRVIEDQGGTIIFESVEGKGSTFGFELPIKAKGGTKRNA
jgi:signal transduction histidine kinase